jgi:hypothetical protein
VLDCYKGCYIFVEDWAVRDLEGWLDGFDEWFCSVVQRKDYIFGLV